MWEEVDSTTVHSHTINHVGFHTRDLQSARNRWEAAGVDITPGGSNEQIWLNAPGGVLVEILKNILGVES